MHISLYLGTTRRIGHAHLVKWAGTTRRIGHAHSARWPGNTRRIRHGQFVKWAGHIEVSLRYSMLPTQLLNRMSSFRSSLRCTSSRDASRAKGVGGRVVAVGCFGLPYDGLGPHLRPIPTGPNGRGSPQKSHPTDPLSGLLRLPRPFGLMGRGERCAGRVPLLGVPNHTVEPEARPTHP